jgi:phenylacetate-CoA ligase
MAVRHSPDAVFRSAAYSERDRATLIPLLGRRFGYREAVICPLGSSTVEAREYCNARAWFPPQVHIARRHLSVNDPPEVNVPKLTAFRSHVLYTYGLYLSLLVAYLRRTGAPFHKPRAIVYSSDGVRDSVRRAIRHDLGIPLFSWYQAVEAFKIAFECEEHAGLHVHVDISPVRLVDEDGRDVPDGEPGEVVVSNLVNRATVLLNYRLGDIAARLSPPCPCGRTLPRITLPQGRTDDCVVLPSGRVLHPMAVRDLLFNEDAVLAFQIRQTALDRIEVALVLCPSCAPAGLRRRLEQRFAQRLRREAIVTFRFVESIPLTAGGKCRAVISEFGRDEDRA